MKLIKVTALVVLILLLGLSTVAFAAKIEGEERYVLASIPGWQNTGITVKHNKAISISAVGLCMWAEGSNEPAVGPDGISYWRAGSNYLAPGLPVMSLVAKVGNGTPVYVGSGPVTLEGEGQLYLGFNDDIYIDNSGSFTAFCSEIKPGYGYGDKNHQHSGPPGKN